MFTCEVLTSPQWPASYSDWLLIFLWITELQKYRYLINQARGPYWENIGPRSWQYGPRCARSVQKRPRADILPVRSWASLVNKRFITRLNKSKDCKNTSAGSFGTMPGPILREYWTGNRAFWLADFSYWPSDCLSRVIKLIIQLSPANYNNDKWTHIENKKIVILGISGRIISIAKLI